MRFVVDSIAGRLAWGATVALFGLLLASLFAVEQVPASVPASLFLLAALTAWKPAIGLAAVAILVPIASWIGRTWHGGVAWPEAVALAFLAGYSAARAFGSRRHRADALVLAIYAFIAIVAASVAVNLQVFAGTTGWDELRRQLVELTTTDYFLTSGGIGGVDAAMRLIEGLLLAHAAAFVVRERPDMRRSLIVAIVVGAVAASTLNLWRIWLGALRLESPVFAFFRYLATLRFNTHYADVNAAGSYFAMTLLPALALVRDTRRWRWAVVAAIIGISLVLSGSRAAFVGVVAAVGLVWFAWRAPARRRAPVRARTVVAGALLAAAMVAGTVYLVRMRNETPVNTALRVRAEFARATLNMVAAYPVFGVGVGRYPTRLSEFAPPGLMAVYPAVRENAHNNFLQVLGELGIAGFTVFVCIIALTAWRRRDLHRTASSDTLQLGHSAGLLAFVVTWLAGHPLLVDEAAFTFWLMLGTAAAVRGAEPRSGRVVTDMASEPRSSFRKGRSLAALGLIVLLLLSILSIPTRVREELRTANLEHLGIGLSRWDTADDGISYRLGGRVSIVFVPSDAGVIELPLRAADPHGTLRVDVYLDGRPADALAVSGSAWRIMNLQIPVPQDGRRFRTLELRLRNGSADGSDPRVMIGKVRPRAY